MLVRPFRKSVKIAMIASASIVLLLMAHFTFGKPDTPVNAPAGPVRDPNAYNILIAAYQAIGGANLAAITDSVTTAQLNSLDSNSASGSLTVKTRGLSQLRSDRQSGTDVFTYVINNGTGWAGRNGKYADLPTENVAISRSDLMPILGQFNRFLNPSTSITLLGTANIQGNPNPAYVINVDEPGADVASDEGVINSGSFLFYVDTKTYLITRISYSLGATNAPGSRNWLEFDYSDYRQTGPIMVPYHVQENFAERPYADIQIQTVTFNQGLTDADFTKPVQP